MTSRIAIAALLAVTLMGCGSKKPPVGPDNGAGSAAGSGALGSGAIGGTGYGGMGYGGKK